MYVWGDSIEVLLCRLQGRELREGGEARGAVYWFGYLIVWNRCARMQLPIRVHGIEDKVDE